VVYCTAKSHCLSDPLVLLNTLIPVFAGIVLIRKGKKKDVRMCIHAYKYIDFFLYIYVHICRNCINSEGEKKDARMCIHAYKYIDFFIYVFLKKMTQSVLPTNALFDEYTLTWTK